MTLFHYTKGFCLPSIFRTLALWPAPPLRCYGLVREEVERDPARFGFQVGVDSGRRFFRNDEVPHADAPEVLSRVLWFEGQVYDVALTKADWCYSALSYAPRDYQERGGCWRLVIDVDGLDLAEYDLNAYPDFQQTTIKSYHLREM